jgi:hypothetical protein
LTPSCKNSTAISAPNVSPLHRVKAAMARQQPASAHRAHGAAVQVHTQAAHGKKSSAPSPGCLAAKEYMKP